MLRKYFLFSFLLLISFFAFTNDQKNSLIEIYNKTYDRELVDIVIKDNIDIGRGDWIVGNKNIPVLKSKFNVKVVWMSKDPLINKAKLILKQKTKEISDVSYTHLEPTRHRYI